MGKFAPAKRPHFFKATKKGNLEMYTKQQFEQFREQCANKAYHCCDNDMSSSMITACTKAAKEIRALPLPAMPMIHKKNEHLSDVKKITLLGQWQCDGTVEAFDVDGMMVIPQEEGVVYVRKEDAMQFFDLVPAMPEQAEPVKEKRAPVQGLTGGIPWEMHLRAYDAYSKRWSPQPALIDLEGKGCRGGFSTGELDMFIPGWREELSERTKMLSRIAELEAEIKQLKGE